MINIRRSLVIPVFLTVIISAPFARADFGQDGFVGSETCRRCHYNIYSQWSKTPHARMLMDAQRYPKAINARFTEDIPFTKNDVFFAIGSHWIQKYMTIIDGEFYVLPKYWNIAEDRWEPYSIFDWRQKTYTETCLGCHTVGLDPETMTYVEECIGCESCHGPGRKHVASEGGDDIVNPAKLDKIRRDMICEACHTDGDDVLTGKYPYPLGYVAGEDLSKYYTDFFLPKPKSQRWYLGDASYLDRHRMFMFYQSKFYSTNRACEVCGFDRGISAVEERYMSRDEYCGTCHHTIYKDFVGHANHTSDQASCSQCHVPTVEESGQRYSIHDHKFDFSQPTPPCAECHGEDFEKTEVPAEGHDFYFPQVEIPENLTTAEACVRCHQDKNRNWAETQIAELKFRYRPQNNH